MRYDNSADNLHVAHHTTACPLGPTNWYYLSSLLNYVHYMPNVSTCLRDFEKLLIKSRPEIIFFDFLKNVQFVPNFIKFEELSFLGLNWVNGDV